MHIRSGEAERNTTLKKGGFVILRQMEDTRNVTDTYKGVPLEQIVADLDTKGTGLEIAIENLERDFNMGTIVRTANAFGVRQLHVIGRKQWNKRGAMMTDKYLHITYPASVGDFMGAIQPCADKLVYAIMCFIQKNKQRKVIHEVCQ